MNHSRHSDMAARKAKKVRLKLVLERLIVGDSYGTIVDDFAEQWNCTPRTVKSYIAECREKIFPSWYEFSDQRIMAAEQIVKTEELFRRAARDPKTYSVALGCLKWIGELQGLTVAQKVAEANLAQPGYAASISLETFNAARRIYGMPEWNADKWDEFHRRDGREKGN